MGSAKAVFTWSNDISKGRNMMYYNGSPAPVYAVDWNSLTNLVNQYFGISLPTVSKGSTFTRQIANNIAYPLNVSSLSPSNKVTAEFFLDLEDSINLLMGGQQQLM